MSSWFIHCERAGDIDIDIYPLRDDRPSSKDGIHSAHLDKFYLVRTITSHYLSSTLSMNLKPVVVVIPQKTLR